MNTIEVSKVDFHYGPKKALDQISLYVVPKSITAFIGPSGCGKSTLLRCFNRMNDRIPGAKITSGEMLINGVDIARPEIDLELLRRDVGMVFQKYNPFPMSIFENVAYGLRIRGEKSKSVLSNRVEESLRAAVLWEECKDRLKAPALGLSGGQQQRLCIARAIAVKPEILLMDEPCAALDPLSTLKIEELLQHLRHDFTIVIVTHNMQQARRCSDQTGFFHMGKLIEIAPTLQLFGNPRERKTEEYLAGKFS